MRVRSINIQAIKVLKQNRFVWNKTNRAKKEDKLRFSSAND